MQTVERDKLSQRMCEAKVREQEDEIFARWRASLSIPESKRFVVDGAVDPREYHRSKPKILLLLKDPHDDHPDGGGWDLRQLIGKGEVARTWNSVTRWVRAIRNPNICWSGMRTITWEDRSKELSSIAAMNLKKVPGGSATIPRELWLATQRDREFIREQFFLYKADLVICCGRIVGDAFKQFVVGPAPWERTVQGVEYLEYEAGKFVISHCHPQARKGKVDKHDRLIDVVKTLIKEKVVDSGGEARDRKLGAF